MPCLLVVDDEPDILLAVLRSTFRGQPLDLIVARTASQGLELARARWPDLVLLDIGLPDMTGLEVFRHLRDLDARQLVIFITATGAADTAIEAMKLGAYDYLFKPVEAAQLKQTVERALEIGRLAQVPAVLPDAGPVDDRADAIIGKCPAMQAVYKGIGRVAGQDVTVLITGESGTGKELVARAVYQHSRRAAAPFLAINCAAIPETLLESELFGHEKGAFTGAERRRIGKFEQCHGGTLFLDEIGDMPLLTQSKVLRVLQDQSFERLGGNETVRCDVRLLAATNQDLETRVNQGRFRLDLFYRLRVFSILLPPLRQRGDDVPLLVNHFLGRYNRELGKQVAQVAPEAMALLRRYPWPGNARELQSILKQALLQATGQTLLPDFLPEDLRRVARPPQPTDPSAPLVSPQFIEDRLAAGTLNLYEEVQQQVEKALFGRVLQHTDGNQLQAARILGVSRGRLRKKLRELGITITHVVEGDEADEED